jgi:hypothetical protein
MLAVAIDNNAGGRIYLKQIKVGTNLINKIAMKNLTPKKIAKTICSVALGALTIYLGVFALWLMLVAGCLQYADQHNAPAEAYCGQDSLTQLVRTTHAPLIALMFGSNIK